jgi:hypothetical protein
MGLKRIEHRNVSVDNIEKNPWNYRGMSEAMFEKEVSSFLAFGYINAILVRRIEGKPGRFQIIDGEHRWKAAQDERVGMKAIDVVELAMPDGAPLDDRTAKKLTIVLNETHGDVRYDDLSKLIADLDATDGHSDLLEELPFPAAELKAMLALFDTGSSGHLGGDDDGAGGGDDEDDDSDGSKVDEWEHVQLRLPPKARAAIDRAVAAITEDIAKMPKEIRLGVGIERLAEEYIARRKASGQPTPAPKKNGAPSGRKRKAATTPPSA